MEQDIYAIPGFPNNTCIPVMASNDDEFCIRSISQILTFKDVELKPNSQGKVIIDLTPLNFKDPGAPTEFEIPKEILDQRAYNRALNAVGKTAFFTNDYKNSRLFYYLDGGRLTIKRFNLKEGGRVQISPMRKVTADKIETVYSRPAVEAAALKLGHSHLELPTPVVRVFEEAIRARQLENLRLIPAGISMLDGLEYFKFNIPLERVSVDTWESVKSLFVDFGPAGLMSGMLTKYPDQVARLIARPAKTATAPAKKKEESPLKFEGGAHWGPEIAGQRTYIQ